MVKPTKTRSSHRFKKVNAKKEISAKAGESVAKSNPTKTQNAPTRWLGTAKGDFVVPADFNDPLPKEIEDLFYKVGYPLRAELNSNCSLVSITI